MKRLVAFSAVLAFVSVCHTTPQKHSSVGVDDRNVAIGLITGGTFGPGSFSTGRHGSNIRGQTQVHVNEDGGGTNNGNTQLYPLKPLTTPVNIGQVGMPGQEGSGSGTIVISAAVLPDHEKNNRNEFNKQPDAVAVYANNGGNNGFHTTGVGVSSGGSIAIGAITGGHFGKETFSLDNKKPGANVPHQQSSVNNGDIGYQNTNNEALFSLGHGFNSPENGVARVDYSHGENKDIKQSIASIIGAIFGRNSENNEHSSAGNGFSTSGQRNVAIGAITGGQFGKATLSPNNKITAANVPHQQDSEINGDIGYQNTNNEALFSLGHGFNSPGNGNVKVDYSHGENKDIKQSIASIIGAIFGGNSGNNEQSSAGNDFSTSGQRNVAIGAITGGQFEKATLSPNNKKPGANVPHQQSSVNNGDIGYQNTNNEALFSLGHGFNGPEIGGAGVDYSHGENKFIEHSSVGNGFSTSGQRSVAIGAITGGNFGEGTLSLDNKRPETNVPQKQNIGYHNTENISPRSMGHGASSNGNDNAGTDHYGQSTGYNAYNNENPWIWNR